MLVTMDLALLHIWGIKVKGKALFKIWTCTAIQNLAGSVFHNIVFMMRHLSFGCKEAATTFTAEKC